MKLNVYAVAALLFYTTTSLWAQQPPQGGGQPIPPPQGSPHGQPPGPDPIAENFFPPEMLMQNQKSLALTEDQKKVIKSEIQKAQARFTDLQWQFQGEQETLNSLVKEDRPDEKQVLAQVDKLLGIESEIKKTQLTLLLRIKNQLTTEQQAKLREMKNQRRPHFGPRGDRGDGPTGGPHPGGDRSGDAPPKD